MKRIALALLLTSVAFAQAKPEFDVATVKLIEPGTGTSESYMPTLDVPPGGTLRIVNRRLDEIIMLAFNISPRQISGPRWLIEPTTDPSVITRYEISAKIPDGAKPADIAVMLQRLLEDRFKLQVHREQQAIQIYSLEVAKGGAKLNASVPNANRSPGCARAISGDVGAAADCYNVTTEQFAMQLASLAPAYFREGPVVDKTGLKGAYDLRLEWMMQQQLDAGMTGPTMFAAVEKLGLTLEKKKEN